jgi:hypothetical protein
VGDAVPGPVTSTLTRPLGSIKPELLDELLLDELVAPEPDDELELELLVDELLLVLDEPVLDELLLVLDELLPLEELLAGLTVPSPESFELQAATSSRHANTDNILSTAILQAMLTAWGIAPRRVMVLPICYALMGFG